jgi:hypothetical protein
MDNLLNTVVQPWFLITFAVAGFFFFLTLGKMSKKP